MAAREVLGEICQIGIVVDKLESVLGHYADLFGLDRLNINHVDTSNGVGGDFTYHGEPVEVKAKIAWFTKGAVEIEIIEPLSKGNIYADFLEKKGPGIHHIMFTAPSYGESGDILAKSDCPQIASGRMQESVFRIFDTTGLLGFYSELADGDPLEPDEIRNLNNS